jgi:hypothetical protein
MRNLSFKQLLLLSSREGKARILNFHPRATILTGTNDTGKSSVLKSLLKTFGAETPTHDDWNRANVISLVHFSVGATEYYLLRQGKTYTVFNAERQPIEQFTSVTNGLGPYLARLFNFGLVLTDSSGESRIPPPAFLFLPYYFDQDRSWGESWRSFERLGQFSNWRQDLVDYHTGVRPNTFYETKGSLGELQKRKEALLAEQLVLRNIKTELREKLEKISFDVDLDAFREEITELLVECEKIQKTADGIKERLVRLHNERIDIEAKIEIVKQSLKEINADFKFLQNKDHIECPSCGAEYQNSFREIFNIALDEDRCQELILSLNEELSQVKVKIAAESSSHSKHEEGAARIKAILALRREEVQLKDLIESESKKQVSTVLQEKAEAISKALFQVQEDLDELKKKLDQLTDKEIKAGIVHRYRALMKSYLFQLHVHGVPEESYKDLHSKIKEQGSDLPRGLLAYGFSILAVMRDNTSSVYCPIVIDSPIQQEQDQENHERIITFIKEKQPVNSQLIMAVVDAKGVDFGGDVYVLDEARSVMNERDFPAAQEFMEPFLQGSLLFGESTR